MLVGHSRIWSDFHFMLKFYILPVKAHTSLILEYAKLQTKMLFVAHNDHIDTS